MDLPSRSTPYRLLIVEFLQVDGVGARVEDDASGLNVIDVLNP